MCGQEVSSYGSWKSPITSDVIVSEAIRFGEIAIDGDDTYWVEMRPEEGGRYVIVRRTSNGHATDMTIAPFNVRSRVHEYGGGAYTVTNGIIYFSNFEDQRIYRQTGNTALQPITPVGEMRYADSIIDSHRENLICVREDHSLSDREAINTLVSVGLNDGQDVKVLVSGADFYSSPRLSPDGSQVAWISWNHPNMPWDGTELWTAQFNADGTLTESRCISGGIDVSTLQPEWSPDGALHFISDQGGCGTSTDGVMNVLSLSMKPTPNSLYHTGNLDCALTDLSPPRVLFASTIGGGIGNSVASARKCIDLNRSRSHIPICLEQVCRLAPDGSYLAPAPRR